MVREVKDCTHIIEDWKDTGDEGTWFRTLEKRDGMGSRSLLVPPEVPICGCPKRKTMPNLKVRTNHAILRLFLPKVFESHNTTLKNVSHHQARGTVESLGSLDT